MVGETRDDKPGAAGELPGHPHRQVVRLAAGAGVHHLAELTGKRREQHLGIIQYAGVQIAGVRVELTRLARDRLHHPGMTMTDRRHVVIRVEVGGTFGVVEPNPFAANEMHGVLVEESIRGAEDSLPTGQQGLFVLRQLARAAGIERVDHDGIRAHAVTSMHASSSRSCAADSGSEESF